jgi:hypothetical protein
MKVTYLLTSFINSSSQSASVMFGLVGERVEEEVEEEVWDPFKREEREKSAETVSNLGRLAGLDEGVDDGRGMTRPLLFLEMESLRYVSISRVFEKSV